LTHLYFRKIGLMQNNDTETVMNPLMKPAHEAFAHSSHRRICKGLPDEQWVHMGVSRVMSDNLSGRAFLQEWMMAHEPTQSVAVSHFFTTLGSQRRLKLVEEINTFVAKNMPSHPNSNLEQFEDLANIELYAGDGHFHQASAHETRIDGKKQAVGHFYTLNLRSHGMTHLAASDQQNGRKKHEHDMHALKRQSIAQLRQGASKGRQVLYIWDSAGIDFNQWHQWKQTGGVYFLSQGKERIKYTVLKALPYEAEAPQNKGILHDEQVTSATCQRPFRRIGYRCPSSGKTYEFITNHMQVRPGVLAWLYMRRWGIEKVYDTFKNKLGEKKAWADSSVAQSMQAQFICLSHNLMVLLESSLANDENIVNKKEIRRSQKRIAEDKKQSTDGLGRAFVYYEPTRRSQLTLKFIRWLRYHLRHATLLSPALESLRRVYALF